MTKQQRKHYLEGGKFRAIYNPTIIHDLNEDALGCIGKTIDVFQNIDILPIFIGPYAGQYRFNSNKIYGWIPEEDLKELEIVHDFISNPEVVNDRFVYRMTFADPTKVEQNFGKLKNNDLPFVIYREYSVLRDDYVINTLCRPTADLIERCTYKTSEDVMTEWETIYKVTV